VTGDVRAFLARWVETQTSRDTERASDLYLRDPAPVVTFSDGERALDWLDVRVRIQRDLSRVVVENVDVHDVAVRELDDAVALATFEYDLHVRDVWGTPGVAHRRATMTLVQTKDGYRIAAAHFSVALA
jgi:hypothetical protein